MKSGLIFIFVFFNLTFCLAQFDELENQKLFEFNKVKEIRVIHSEYQQNGSKLYSDEISIQQIDEIGRISKEINRMDGLDEPISYSNFEYHENCNKLKSYELFNWDEKDSYYSLIRNEFYLDENCSDFYQKYYHLNFIESIQSYSEVKNGEDLLYSIHLNNLDKTESYYSKLDNGKTKIEVFENKKPIQVITELYDEKGKPIEICIEEESINQCSYFEYLYANDKLIEEKYFQTFNDLTQTIQFDYLENGLVKEKRIYLTNEDVLYLSSKLVYEYQYY